MTAAPARSRSWLFLPALMILAAVTWVLLREDAPAPEPPALPAEAMPAHASPEPEDAPATAGRLTMTATEVEHLASAEDAVLAGRVVRSEERRVGKEWRSRGAPYHEETK